MAKFSVVFMPDSEAVHAVREMIEILAGAIGWFNSKNALAHFTVFEFHDDGMSLTAICNQLACIASGLSPFDGVCRSFGQFDNGTFYLKPEPEPFEKMKAVMTAIIHKSGSIKKTVVNTTPHMSVARRLTPEKIETARQLLTKADVRFTVTCLTLRKFDEQIRQYAVFKEFPLLQIPPKV